jgi:protein-disulfide isomerase
VRGIGRAAKEEWNVHRNTILAGVAAASVLILGLAAWQFGNWATDEAPPSGSQTAADAADADAAIGPLADDGGQAMPLFEDDHILGSPDAPITMIEYASLTCPHCAKFHNDILPEIKKNYIDEGLVKLVFRDFPLDRVALHAAQIAHCAPDDSYFRILGVMFSSQEQWATAADPAAALEQIGRTGGVAPDALATCVADDGLVQKILTRAQEGKDVYGIQSTPSFIINGRLVTGAQPYEDFDEILRGMLPKS